MSHNIHAQRSAIEQAERMIRGAQNYLTKNGVRKAEIDHVLTGLTEASKTLDTLARQKAASS